MEELARHQASEIFPLMTQSALDELATDIQANGLKKPIALLEDKILDGRARYLACQMTGVEPSFKKVNLNGSGPYEYVITHNLKTRSLSVPQRAAIAVEILPILTQQARDRKAWLLTEGNQLSEMPEELGKPGQAIAQAAELLDLGQSSVDRARLLLSKRPDLLSRMKAGEFKTLNQARRAGGERWRGEVLLTEGKVKMYGRGDRWNESIKPIRMYLTGWKRRGFEFRHINPTEARKRLREIDVIEEQLAAVRADLEQRSFKAHTSFKNNEWERK